MMEGRKCNKLTEEQMHFFETEGYVMIGDVFDPADLQPLRDEVAATVDGLARDLVASGQLSAGDAFPEEGVDTRLVRIHERNPQAAELIMKGLNGYKGRGYRGQALFHTVTHAKLLAVIEDLVGPEIISSSVSHIRPKLPRINRGVVPWHQDSGIWMPHCDEHLIVTCWLPLVHATYENGCLSILPRAHKSGIFRHYTEGFAGFLEILPQDLPQGIEPVVVEVPLGGAIFFTNRTPHCSTPNHSDIVRWSFDFRYQSMDTPNNVGQLPENFSMALSEREIACHPPEADALVRTSKHPEKLIRTYEQFLALRNSYIENFDENQKWYVKRWGSLKESKPESK